MGIPSRPRPARFAIGDPFASWFWSFHTSRQLALGVNWIDGRLQYSA
jgi:hypothetical protein